MKFNMNKICKEEECTGCMACYNICPKNCITMEYNKYGELQPKIDESKCIHCNLCRKVCPNNSEINKNTPVTAFATWSKDENDRKTSTSGAIASIFYKEAIDKGYIVFGTSFDENLILKHSYTHNKEEALKYKGSKYCQSNIGRNYENVGKFLKEDKKVIFIGTPCQIQGLNKYLEIKNINKSNLITVDLVCHGVPSQQYLTNYINYLEKKYKCKATNVSFRDSEKYIFKLLDKDKIIVSIPNTKDLYLKAFGLSMIQRESCLECKYASPNRVSDITIGDFWGIQNDSKINNEEKEKGISLVLINTEKGKSFFENCTSNIFYEERNIEEAINGNAHLRRTSPKNKFRIKFREQYNSDFVRSAKKTIGFAMLKENVKLYLIKIKHIFFKGDQL